METQLTFTGILKRETAKAYLLTVTIMEFDPGGGGGPQIEEDVWLPKSRTQVLGDKLYRVPMWLARKSNLVSGSMCSYTARYQQAL